MIIDYNANDNDKSYKVSNILQSISIFTKQSQSFRKGMKFHLKNQHKVNFNKKFLSFFSVFFSSLFVGFSSVHKTLFSLLFFDIVVKVFYFLFKLLIFLYFSLSIFVLYCREMKMDKEIFLFC